MIYRKLPEDNDDGAPIRFIVIYNDKMLNRVQYVLSLVHIWYSHRLGKCIRDTYDASGILSQKLGSTKSVFVFFKFSFTSLSRLFQLI